MRSDPLHLRTMLLLGLALLVVCAAVGAQTFSPVLSFQGRLADVDTGKPMPDGQYDVTFTIYDAETDGNDLWQETQTVEQIGGVFSVYLGSVTPFPGDLFTGGDRWLALQVAEDDEMGERFRFTPSPWSLYSATSGTDDDWAFSGNDIYRLDGNVGIGNPLPEYPLDVVGDVRANARAAFGNDGVIGLNDSIYDKIFDFSHTITDFSTSQHWQPLRSYITLDPAVDLTGANATYIYGHDLDTWIPADNDKDFEYVQGPYLAAFHQGTGTVGYMSGGSLVADNWGDVVWQVGAYIASGAAGTASITDNYGLDIWSGHRGSDGSIANDHTMRIRSPDHDRPLGNHYGIYLEDQDFGENDSYAIYSAGGMSYFQDNVGIGVTDPDYPLHVETSASRAVFGESTTSGGVGVHGLSSAFSGGGYGVYGENYSTTGVGVIGIAAMTSGANYGVYGQSQSSTGRGVYGLANTATGVNYGVYGKTNSAEGYAGYFEGDVHITGTLSKGGGSFKIDHPLDPENMYLSHSFVESPDMMNVYNGNMVLDENGEAWVDLPDWFEALNGDFRYQLTCIGGFAPVYIAEEVSDNCFKIAGGEPGMRVSWQVTGIRHDPYADAHRIPVERDKPEHERGRYLHPDLYGQPGANGICHDRRGK